MHIKYSEPSGTYRRGMKNNLALQIDFNPYPTWNPLYRPRANYNKSNCRAQLLFYLSSHSQTINIFKKSFYHGDNDGQRTRPILTVSENTILTSSI